MEAKCPVHGTNTTFRTGATVRQIWEVDSTGEFLKEVNGSVEVTEFPRADEVWTCCKCGAQAEVTGD